MSISSGTGAIGAAPPTGVTVDCISRILIGQRRYFRFHTTLNSVYDDMDNADSTNSNALLMTAHRHIEHEGGDAQLDALAAAIQ